MPAIFTSLFMIFRRGLQRIHALNVPCKIFQVLNVKQTIVWQTYRQKQKKIHFRDALQLPHRHFQLAVCTAAAAYTIWLCVNYSFTHRQRKYMGSNDSDNQWVIWIWNMPPLYRIWLWPDSFNSPLTHHQCSDFVEFNFANFTRRIKIEIEN